jgi:hypothetical protein
VVGTRLGDKMFTDFLRELKHLSVQLRECGYRRADNVSKW